MDLDGMSRSCHMCGRENPADAAFCGSCGASIMFAPSPGVSTPACPACGNATEEGASFCGICGQALVPPAVESDPTGVVPPVPAPGVLAAPTLAVPAYDEEPTAVIPPVGPPVQPGSSFVYEEEPSDGLGWYVLAAVALIAVIGGIVALVFIRGRDDDRITTIDRTTLPTETPPPTEDATTLSPTTTAAAPTTQFVPSTVLTTAIPASTAPTATVRPTVGATVVVTVPATRPAATQPPTSPEPETTVVDTAPSSDPTTSTSTPPTTATGTTVPGDLAIAGAPMSKPACDEQFITVVASAIDPARYEEVVGMSLEGYGGSQYLRTDQTCSSLRQSFNGNPIYVVYFGPFASEEEACARRSDGPDDAYVRVLSSTLPSNHVVDCE